MEGLPHDWVKDLINKVADDVDQMIQDATQAVADTIDEITKVSEAIATEVQEAIALEIEQIASQFQAWAEPNLQLFIDFDVAVQDATDLWIDDPWVEAVDPASARHPVCQGCMHYHGRRYGGQLLVCAMHPYGIEDGVGTCPDKE